MSLSIINFIQVSSVFSADALIGDSVRIQRTNQLNSTQLISNYRLVFEKTGKPEEYSKLFRLFSGVIIPSVS